MCDVFANISLSPLLNSANSSYIINFQNFTLHQKLNLELHAFFKATLFTSNGKLKLAKNQANARQHLEAELLLFGNYSHSSSTLSSKNNCV